MEMPRDSESPYSSQISESSSPPVDHSDSTSTGSSVHILDQPGSSSETQFQNVDLGASTSPDIQLLPQVVIVVSGESSDEPVDYSIATTSANRTVTVAIESPATNIQNVETSSENQPQTNANVMPASSTLTETTIQRTRPLEPSDEDFRSPKKLKAAPPCESESDEDDGCSICFEPWNNSGTHRLASLKCGHIFGQSCIEKWLKGSGGKCPQCNSKAKRSDIRIIYAKTIKVIDTSERDRAVRELEQEREARRNMELEVAQARFKYQLIVDECNRIRDEVKRNHQLLQQVRGRSKQVSRVSRNRSFPSCSQQLISSSNSGFSSQFPTSSYVFEKMLDISRNGGCRVLAVCEYLGMLIVSQPSANTLFPGYGIKKINTLDFKAAEFVPIHGNMIRDMCFNSMRSDGLLLSVGLDKTAKLTSVLSNTVVQTYKTDVPLWSCAWNLDNPLNFYAGQVNGSILVYDTRSTNRYIKKLTIPGSFSPIVALQYANQDLSSSFSLGGIIVGQLDKCIFYELKSNGEYRPHILPLEGTLTSLSFEPVTRHLLASFRPSSKHPRIRHLLCELTCINASRNPTIVDPLCSCNIVQNLEAGKLQTLLSRSCVFTHPSDNNRLLISAGDEDSQTCCVWDGTTGLGLQRTASNGPVLDINPIYCDEKHYLATLTDKAIRIHKWVVR